MYSMDRTGFLVSTMGILDPDVRAIMNTAKSKISGIRFQCDDVNRTNSFYESIGVNLNDCGVNIFLAEKRDYATPSPVVVMVKCEDVAVMAESLKDSGVTVIEPATLGLTGLTMIIADPDGRHILLTEGIDKLKLRIDAFLASGSAST